ncbi:MAG: PadR family transcriptional regulator [bacterium]
MRKQSDTLTLADVVVLSMLAERAMHGYELWAELERREVRDWAAISKPQVYYSLRKLDADGHIEPQRRVSESLGPERRVYRTTAKGRRVLADALARDDWATQRPPAPFHTWMVLSWQARPEDAVAQVARRHDFLERQLVNERAALESIIEETSPSSDAAMMVRLVIRLFETELEWLDEVSRRHRPAP